jgi:arabinogalactan endo-1,4-beta-galactosidase
MDSGRGWNLDATSFCLAMLGRYSGMRQLTMTLSALCIVLAGWVRTCDDSRGQLRHQPHFIKGADVSFLDEIEEHGGTYGDNGVAGDALEILKGHGFNYIRLRTWHTPEARYCTLGRTLAMARRIRELNLGLLLDLHYSDTWADPGRQTKPAAWAGLPFEETGDSIYQYTRHVIAEMGNQNTLPDMIQIGNEITCGMLWDDGRVCGPFDTRAQWVKLARLITEAIRGVNDGLGVDDSISIMIHIDCGGDTTRTREFFDRLLAGGVDFDIIGLSYYPWWHGTLADLSANLDMLARRYDKDIIVVETAYPWTLGWCDDTHNIVGLPEQLHPGYPASVDGQSRFLIDLMTMISATPGGRGRGLFYWSPEYISVPTHGSPWENMTLFDFSGLWHGGSPY